MTPRNYVAFRSRWILLGVLAAWAPMVKPQAAEAPALPDRTLQALKPAEAGPPRLPALPGPTSPFGLKVDPGTLGEICEVAPIRWENRLALMKCNRPASGGVRADYYLSVEDVETGREHARFATGYGLACAYVQDGNFYAFASRFEAGDWNDVTLFKSKDLQTWTSRVVVRQQKEHLFNSSVCRGPDGFVMAYESNDPEHVPFTIKFAVSPDLENWTTLPDIAFGKDRYAACPCLRYADGFYYMLYLEHRQPRWYFETFLARSRDLRAWEMCPANPMLSPGPEDGVNASDPDLIEFEGKTYLYFSVGDQRTWSKLRRAIFPGPISELLGKGFSPSAR